MKATVETPGQQVAWQRQLRSAAASVVLLAAISGTMFQAPSSGLAMDTSSLPSISKTRGTTTLGETSLQQVEEQAALQLSKSPLVNTATVLDSLDENAYLKVHLLPLAVENRIPWGKVPFLPKSPPIVQLLERTFSDSRVALTGFLSGALLEAFFTVLLFPLLTVKTRLQRLPSPSPFELLQTTTNRPWLWQTRKSIEYKIREGLKSLDTNADGKIDQSDIVSLLDVNEDGKFDKADVDAAWRAVQQRADLFKNPFAGVGPVLALSAPSGAVYYASKDVIRRNLLAAAGITSGTGTTAMTTAITAGTSPAASSLPTPIAPLPPVIPSVGVGSSASSLSTGTPDLQPLPPFNVDWELLGLDLKTLCSLAALALGWTARVLVRTPGEVISTKAQLRPTAAQNGDDTTERSPFFLLFDADVARKSLAFFPTILAADLPGVMLRTWSVQVLKEVSKVPELDFLGDYLFYAATASVIYFLTTPLDVARTRLLAQATLGGDSAQEPIQTGESQQPRYSGFWDCLTTISREEGVEGLFAGWVPRVLYFGVILSIFTPLRRDGYLRLRELIILGADS